jgi:hypothetical protein
MKTFEFTGYVRLTYKLTRVSDEFKDDARYEAINDLEKMFKIDKSTGRKINDTQIEIVEVDIRDVL